MTTPSESLFGDLFAQVRDGASFVLEGSVLEVRGISLALTDEQRERVVAAVRERDTHDAYGARMGDAPEPEDFSGVNPHAEVARQTWERERDKWDASDVR